VAALPAALALPRLVAETQSVALVWGARTRLWRHVLDANPHDTDAWNALGSALDDAGPARRDEALDAYGRAIEIDRALHGGAGGAGAWNNLGATLAAAGRDDRAEDAYRRAVAVNPTLREPRSNLGGLLSRGGAKRCGEALWFAESAVALSPAWWMARSNLGEALHAAGRAAEAAAAVRAALPLVDARTRASLEARAAAIAGAGRAREGAGPPC
jgi:Flp pilus assembly protein TadD